MLVYISQVKSNVHISKKNIVVVFAFFISYKSIYIIEKSNNIL